MIDKNDPKYAHYPHINKDQEQRADTEEREQQDLSPQEPPTKDDPILESNTSSSNNAGRNKKSRKTLAIAICLLAVLSIAAVVFVQFFRNNTEEPEYFDLDVAHITNGVIFKDDDDVDQDGLTNGEERELGTDPQSFDTDGDGLCDYDEIKETYTDPLKVDTDVDGVDDGTEIALGLDPLNAKTDGTPDGDRKFEISHRLDEGSLSVTGKSGVANIYARKVQAFNKANNPGVVSDMYEFYIEGEMFESATLQLTYDDSVFNNSEYTEADLAIFQYMNDGTYEKVGGEIDTENNTVTAKLEHFSKYCLAISPVVTQKTASKVFIVLDNSGSMYPVEMCEGSDENDVDFKRIDFAKNLIEASNLDEVKFGIAKFTGDYMELCGGFDNDKETMFTQLESIKTTKESFTGTHIAEAIISACTNFDADDLNHRKFIVILTDGVSTEGQGLLGIFDPNENDAIRAANKKNVSIIVVGLGNSIDIDYCNKIATGTNGKFIYANNSSALEDVYTTINAIMNNGYVDLDGDGEMDHIAIADSGFDMTLNSFSFNNYIVKSPYNDELIDGQCHGMAVFAQRYYLGTLPQKADAIPRTKVSLIGGWIQGVSYDLTANEFFANGDSDYTLSKTNLREFILFPEIHKYMKLTNNVWDRYQRNADDENYFEFVPEFKQYIEDHPLLSVRKVEFDTVRKSVNKADETEFQFKSIDSVEYSIDVDYESLSDEHKAQYQVLAAFNNLWASQAIDSYNVAYHFNDDTFQTIIDLINSGVIPVICGNGHSTNLTHIYRDIDNPFKYTLLVYDNNDHSKFKTMALTLTKYNKLALDATAWTNEYKFEIYDTDGIHTEPGKIFNFSFDVYVK